MNRRSFLKAGLGFAVTSYAYAANSVIVNTNGYRNRRAWVKHPKIIRQRCPEWCWAASISMIFDYHRHPVRQERIVQETYGGLTCSPSGNPITIARNLNRSWVDDNGKNFESQVVAAYDQWNGVNAITNNFIINELSNNKPILYCNTHHAMVCVSIDYVNTSTGPYVERAAVLDPWPANPQYHFLSPLEIMPVYRGGQMTFLAAVTVTG